MLLILSQVVFSLSHSHTVHAALNDIFTQYKSPLLRFPSHRHQHHVHHTLLTEKTRNKMNQPSNKNRCRNVLNIKCRRIVNSPYVTGLLSGSNLTVKQTAGIMGGLRTLYLRIRAKGYKLLL